MKPEIGMGATKKVGSDRVCYTVVNVLSPRKLVVQYDNQRCISENGYDWEISPDPQGHTTTISLRKNGAWVEVGQSMKSDGRFSLGHRSPYRDPHF